MEIAFSGPAAPQLQVVNALQRKEILLIFDNMEHLTAGSSLLAEILQQASGVKMLLTSREQIHLQWEWIFDVHGELRKDVGNNHSGAFLSVRSN